MSQATRGEDASPCWKLSRNPSTALFALVALFFLGGVAKLGAASEQDTAKQNHILDRIEVEGNNSVSKEEILKILGLKVGKRTNNEKIQQAFGRLRTVYINRGFLEVQLSTDVTSSPAELTADIQIKEGPLFCLGTLSVQGNQEVSTENIRRELEIQPGDPFSPTKIIEGNKRLYAAGCFEAVDLVVSTSPASTIDVKVKVRERRQRFIKGGVGYGTETKERLTAGFEDQNFLGGARRADIKYTYSGFLTQPEKNETRSLESTLIQPFIFGTRMEGQFSLKRSRKFREAYDSVENEMKSSLERRFRAAFSTRLTYRLEGTNLTRVSPEAETPSVTSINAVGTSLRFDNTNDPFLPRNGWRTIGSLEEGLRLLKNDVGFHKLETRLGRFDTIDSGWTFFEGFQLGLLLPHSGDKVDIIPINERFFLGGANSVRGYTERSLGPKDDQGDPLGGTFFLVTNFEVRHKIYKKIFGVLFYDAGNLFNYDPGDTNPQVQLSSWGDLRQSCGVGLRLHSPVGAIRLEGGYQLNPEETSLPFEDRTAIHFSIGEVF